MTINKFFLIIIFSFTVKNYSQEKIILSDDLVIIKLTDNVFIHISYLETQSFGRVACNGVIYINDNEAVVLDTPPDTLITSQLINWLNKDYSDIKISGVVVTHFHDDCLGGLEVFHKRGIKSYSHELTPEFAEKNGSAVPSNTFKEQLEIRVGIEKIICCYFGEAHTSDNIVVWIPKEEILFGGCMIKSLNSSKGNLADANVNEWSNTVGKVKKKFSSAKFVIPGHGNYGGTELLDYTIDLFSVDD